mgnify:CR=1 FL=1
MHRTSYCIISSMFIVVTIHSFFSTEQLPPCDEYNVNEFLLLPKLSNILHTHKYVADVHV